MVGRVETTSELWSGGPLEEAVELAVVVLDEPALPAVVRVAVPAPLVVRGERVVRVGVAVDRGDERQVVTAVGAGYPAEEVVERAVLHHEGDDVADAAGTVGQDRARSVGDGLGQQVGAVTARPVEAAAIWRNLRRLSIRRS
jgi:hypothetical protein